LKDTQTHIIKSQQYEIELNDASQGYAYQSRVSQLQEHSIQIILQKVMDKYHFSEYLDQYDEIVLDLGTVSESNFDREISYKIEETFIEFFKNNTFDNGTLIKGKRKPIYKTKIDQFVYFLKNGYLQWDTPSSIKPIELLLSALRNNKEELVAILKKEGQKESVRKRLISQLQDIALEKIVIAIKNEEGIYINQHRNDIMQYQQNQTIVEINNEYFRKAIWEITLAYIFTEVSGYSNQTSFLKYLIHKIAVKYNLTYKSLLKKIVLGIKRTQNGIKEMPNFGKIAIMLQEQVEKEELAFDPGFKEGEGLNFITTLKYYLNNNSLPVNSSITTLAIFSKNIIDTIQKDSTKFYTVFYEFLQQGKHIDRFTNSFSDSLLNTIVEGASDTILVTISRFFKQMINISNKLSIRSVAINQLQKRLGKISLNTYEVIRKTSTDTISTFLNQIIKEIVIDQEFVIILRAFENEREFKSYREVLFFIEEITIVKKNNTARTVYAADFFKFSEKLYAYYDGKKEVSLKQFQAELEVGNYSEESFILMTVLLDLYIKDKNCSKEALVEWILKRLIELTSKGKKTRLILAQVHDIAQMLCIDKIIIDAINVTEKTYLEKNSIEVFSSENKTIDIDQISSKMYQQLIETIKNKLFERSKQDLYSSVEEVIALFSEKHNIDKGSLLTALKRDNVVRNIPEFVKNILEQIEYNKYSDPYNKQNDDKYDLNSVQYFFAKGQLPWWMSNKSLNSFQESLSKVLNKYPERFVSWFKQSKYKKVIIDMMNDDLFEVFVKQVNTSVTSSVIVVKQLFDKLLQKDLSGVKNILPAHHKALRYMVLEYIQRNQQIEVSKLTEFIIQKLAQLVTVAEGDLYQIFLGRIRYDKLISNVPENLESWLLTVVKEPTSEYKSLIQKIEKEKSWKEAISLSSSKEIIDIFKTVYTKSPQELKLSLKQASFRKRLITRLSVNDQKEVVKLFFLATDMSQLLAVFEIFKKLRKEITTKNYQVVWSCFIDKLVLKIAISTTANWSINDWSLLLIESMSSMQHSKNIIEVLPNLSIYNNTSSEKIINEMQNHIAQKDSENKQDDDYMVPEVIEEETVGESIFIENAGMVILGPYISMLFDRMGLLENKMFKNNECLQKAIYVLQYAVTGKTEPEEPELLLNKIICGMDIHTPISGVISLELEERELIDGLLKAIISHWSTIGNTSVEGLRGSFLCRQGRVTIEEDKYVLVVEEKTYDMLLDNIPWTIGQLKLSWMQKLVEVIWRS